MKTIRVHFADYYGTKPEDIWAYCLLCRHYDVKLDAVNPEYLIDGGLGSDHLDYPNAIKIVIVGESYVPDFNLFDYAVGFDYLDFGDRYLRIPLFASYSQFRDLCSRSPIFNLQSATCDALTHRDFCSFVVSNADGDPMRLEFFRRLSKYKHVVSGGKLFNNVGGRVPDKSALLAKCKFNIAFENSVVPGYTTEKVMEPLAVRSVPIYYGNPRIAEDFNPACMIRVSSRDDVERAVEEIIRLDKDDAAYLAKLTAPSFLHPVDWYEERFDKFLRAIFDPPIAEARRLNAFGYQTNIRHRAEQAYKVYFWTHPSKMIRRLRHTVIREEL